MGIVLAKKLKFGNAILCEHAIRGNSHKAILVNVYAGDILVNSFPATLTFGIYIETAVNPDVSTVQLEIAFGSDHRATMTADLNPSEATRTGVIMLPLLTITVEKELLIKVTAKAEGYAKTTLIRKRLYQGNVQGV